MEIGHHPAPAIRFADFELDTRAGELRHAGTKIRLGEHAFHILLMLLERPGEVVTRDELHELLWSSDGSVDFEDGLNHAIRKLREALHDSAQHPRFVETLPRHGYRFIAPVERSDAPGALPVQSAMERQRAGPSRPAALAGGGHAQPLGSHGKAGIVLERPALKRRVFAVAVLGVVALAAILLRPAGVVLSHHQSGSREMPALKIESVAVLPFENLSRDPEQEHFADGMTGDLIASLAKMGSFGVISRASAMQYKGTQKPSQQIGRELDVDALLEGTVVRSGDRVRITARLVHAATGGHLWAETYDSGLLDVVDWQDQVAQAIAHEVGLRLTPQQHVRLRTDRPATPEAYEAFLKGRHYWNIQTPAGQLKCIEYYKQTIQKDAKYALAYAQMAHCYDTLSFWEFPPRGNTGRRHWQPLEKPQRWTAAWSRRMWSSQTRSCTSIGTGLGRKLNSAALWRRIPAPSTPFSTMGIAWKCWAALTRRSV